MNFASNNSSLNEPGNEASSSSTACYVNDTWSVKLGRIIAYSVLILASLLGNIFIIAVVHKYGKTRKTVNYAVVNMAAASLIITTTYMPRLIPMFLIGSDWLVQGSAGYALCKTVPFLHGVAILASVMTLLASSVDTFLAVVFPLKKLFTPKVAKLAIFLTWALSVISRLPYLLALKTKMSGARQICSGRLDNAFSNENARAIYYTFLLITFYAFPWLAILIFYSTVAFILKRGKTPRQEGITAVRLNRARGRATKKVLKMMVVITIVFLVCWITYFLVFLIFSKVPCSVRFWRLFLAHCNCAINPILFSVFNTTVQRGIRDVLRKCRGSARQSSDSDGFLGSIFTRAMKRKKMYISPRRKPTAFSIDVSLNMATFNGISRKTEASRGKVAESELGSIINEGFYRKASYTNSIISFRNLEC